MACDIDDREGESPSPMEPRLGRMFHSSAAGRRREHTLPEALGLRQAVQPRDDLREVPAVRRGRPGAMQPTEPRSRAQPGCATRIRELTAYAATGDRPRRRSDSRSSGAPSRREGALLTAAVNPAQAAREGWAPGPPCRLRTRNHRRRPPRGLSADHLSLRVPARGFAGSRHYLGFHATGERA
jgi:hypothetical protein